MSQHNQTSINVAVVISFGHGTFESGFPVGLRILNEGREIYRFRERLKIPPVPELPKYYEEWKTIYTQQERTRSTRQIDVPPQVTQRSLVNECRDAANQLEEYIQNTWLKNPIFKLIRSEIQANTRVEEDQSIPIIFAFDTGNVEQDAYLKRLPWSHWDLFDFLDNAESALITALPNQSSSLSSPVKILAIYGSDEGGLDLTQDQEELQQIENAGAVVYAEVQPNSRRLHELLTETEDWDILFFAGHSYSNENLRSGFLQLGPGFEGIIELKALRDDLRSAVKRGLKIAIFNSCDGLGIAGYLTNELQVPIPCVLVFKEAVPDQVAREFLKKFLKEFKNGTPLYLAVRKARSGIRFMEIDFDNPYPCASWLPVVYQNPNQPEFVWPSQLLAEGKSDNLNLKLEDASNSEDIVDREILPRPLPKWLYYAGLVIVGFVAAILVGAIISGDRGGEELTPIGIVQISSGTSIIDNDRQTESKQNGVDELRASPPNYKAAISAFSQSLQEEPDDPETWIYLNNAIADQQTAINVVEIATALPIDNLRISREILRGVAQAQTAFNCGVEELTLAIDNQEMPACNGTTGKLIKIQIAGSAEERVNTTNNASAVAQQLSSIDSILAVVGHFSSSASLQAADKYAENSLIAISPTSTAVRLGDYRNFLRTPPSDAFAAQYLAEYATQQLGLDKVAVVHLADGSSAFSQSFTDEFRKNLPSNSYVYEGESCDLSQGLDFNEEECVNNALTEGAEAILMVPDTDPQLALALRVANVDEDIVLLGADSVYNSLSLDYDGVYAKQLTVAVPWHRSDTKFEQNADLMYPNLLVNWRSAMSYDAVKSIAGVLEEISNSPSREEFLDKMNELRETGFEGGVLAEEIRFDSKGDRVQQDGLGVIVTIDPEERKFVLTD